MGNQLCSEDGLETTSYKVKSRTSGVQMIQRAQWYQPQSRQEDTGTPLLSLTVRTRLEALGTRREIFRELQLRPQHQGPVRQNGQVCRQQYDLFWLVDCTY